MQRKYCIFQAPLIWLKRHKRNQNLYLKADEFRLGRKHTFIIVKVISPWKQYTGERVYPSSFVILQLRLWTELDLVSEMNEV